MSLFQISPDPDVNTLVERCGYATAALTVLPIPGSEILGVMPLHVGMVVGIGHQHGQDLTRETAMELLLQIGTTVGASLVGSRIATTAAKFALPGLGGFLAAPFMFASTLAIGAVADSWFRADGAMSESDMKAVYQRAMKSAKKGFQPEKMRSDEVVAEAEQAVASAKAAGAEVGEATPAPDGPGALVERLKRGKEMLEAGLIDQEEFDALKARILAEI
jgi:uncharacterized protein (DUF697 family)